MLILSFFVGLENPQSGGMLSYPDTNSINRVLNHPDMFTLSMLSERSRLDFRVLVVLREAKDILRSASKKSTLRFGADNEPETLIANAEALYTQLKLIDKSFYHCVYYKQLTTLSKPQTTKLIDFLHPVIMKSTWPLMVQKVIYSNHSDEDNAPLRKKKHEWPPWIWSNHSHHHGVATNRTSAAHSSGGGTNGTLTNATVASAGKESSSHPAVQSVNGAFSRPLSGMESKRTRSLELNSSMGSPATAQTALSSVAKQLDAEVVYQ